MNIDSLIQEQIAGHLINVSWLLYIDSDEPVRAWNGVGRLAVGPWGADTTGGDYLGIGALIEVPALQQLVNGVAQRIEISLSGVDAQIVSLADEGASEIRAKDTNVGMLFMDGDWQPLATPLAVWTGESDSIRCDSAPDSDGNKKRTISLSVGSTTTGRRRPRYNLYTRAQQRQKSPTDAGCDRVALYSQERELKWP